MTYDKILVLDFGSQYNQLIARRIREMGVYSELRPHEITAKQIREIEGVKGIVFSGGPRSVYEADAFNCDPEIFSMGLPIMTLTLQSRSCLRTKSLTITRISPT